MKIYFAGAIRAGRQDAGVYRSLIEHLRTYGDVLTEHVGIDNPENTIEKGWSDNYIHDRDMEWLLQSDVLIAEVTTPSLGVGYEIGRAVEHGIDVLCLCRHAEGKRPSAMLTGSPGVRHKLYHSIEEGFTMIDDFLAARIG